MSKTKIAELETLHRSLCDKLLSGPRQSCHCVPSVEECQLGEGIVEVLSFCDWQALSEL